MAKPPVTTGEPIAIDLSVVLARLDALETLVKNRLEEVEALLAKAAPLSDFEELTETVQGQAKSVADRVREAGLILDHDDPLDDFAKRFASLEVAVASDPIMADLVSDGTDLRGDLLKAFRQIESIALAINVRLPA